MDGTQIYQNFTAGNSQSLQTASDIVKQLSDGYRAEADAIKALQQRMAAAWTGGSGDAATAGAEPLAAAFAQSAPPLDTTTKSMQTQSDAFEKSKSSVVEVPPAPAKPSPWSTGLKAAIPFVGPSMAAGDIQSYEQGLAATNAANENNVRVMDQYSNVTGSTRDSIPMDYQALALDGASVGLAPAKPGSIGSTDLLYSDRTNASSTTSPATGNTVGNVGPVSSGPSLNGPSTTSGSGPAGTGGPASPVSSGPSLPATSNPGGGGGTNASTFIPPAATTGYTDSTQRPGGSNYRSGTADLPGAGRNSAANRLYDSESGGSGRGGSLGGRGGASQGAGRGGSATGESARSLGAGKGTGAGNLGGAAAEEAAARRSAARGASGTPMGAAGQRGKGEDDDEHKRPDYLIEADPDSVFGTDVRATPPVIGE
ncbi:hypothetical protein HFP15_14740 [Amycolatopsis sp. K13G38]|uniref:PPE domain-containing protein n=1 Tax=Amycolatopsis acididurans TaxID=2724524 RepID=A0ABX1J2Z6_9PSEU|nr:hypothetical protein [Amycolatopsis acididurans]NKQ54143.1 hypothetical protein [Amycolatopsis acididurans]